MTRVVGLDLSLTRPGICSTTGVAWSYATPDLRGVQRLIHLRDYVLEHTLHVDLVVVEDYAFAQAKAAHKIGELHGVVRVALAEADRCFVPVAPTARAKYATGKGNAKKSEVVSAWSARTGIPFDGDDACDAHILRAMALDHYGEREVVVPETHRVALKNVIWPRLAA